jgi:hypothetical protein
MRPRALRKAQADEFPMNSEGVFVLFSYNSPGPTGQEPCCQPRPIGFMRKLE